MMQQCCGSYQCYSAGECSCGSNSFHAQNNYYNFYETSETYSFDPSSPVDCTLSLGTPSTRMTEYDEKRREEQQSANYSWELPRPKHAQSSKRSGRGGGGGGGAEKSNANSDRHCASCDTTTTPLWRNGPSGPKSLCNACGIRYKKEERKAANSGQGSSIYRNEADSWLPHNHSQRTQRFSHGVANDINPSVAFLSWSLNDSEQPQIYYNFTT